MSAPLKHQGIHFERLNPTLNNPREVAFAEQWRIEQSQGNVLHHLIGRCPTQEEATVAATVIQWLGSNVGMSFIEEACGREPKLKSYLKSRLK